MGSAHASIDQLPAHGRSWMDGSTDLFGEWRRLLVDSFQENEVK
jgi:predicted translin family RNA/ssDNA-binding protein